MSVSTSRVEAVLLDLIDGAQTKLDPNAPVYGGVLRSRESVELEVAELADWLADPMHWIEYDVVLTRDTEPWESEVEVLARVRLYARAVISTTLLYDSASGSEVEN